MPQHHKHKGVRQRPGRVYLILLLLLLAGCAAPTPAGPQPTLLPTADAVMMAVLLSRTPAGSAEARPGQPPVTPTVTTTPTVTRWPITEPFGTAIRPGDALLLRPPELPPDQAADAPNSDWRPPPLPVPLSIHPDDHYWMIRPIPSGKRNYDLEWYPFGNDVLVPSLYPFRIHHGLDFPNETGTPILAASSGTVIHAGPLVSNRNGVNYYGNTVIIQHDWQWLGQDVFTLYAHTLQLFVAVGDHVEEGQLIAGVGASGEVSGPHLHFEVRVGSNNYNDVRNPMLWIAPYEGWGTLAGRLVDRRGRYITNAEVTITPVNVAGSARTQRTYLYSGVQADDIWRENFVFGDVPAGRYRVLISVGGIEYRNFVDVLPGRTNFLTIGTEFEFVPTETPTPTNTPVITTTLPLSSTTPISSTVPVTGTPTLP